MSACCPDPSITGWCRGEASRSPLLTKPDAAKRPWPRAQPASLVAIDGLLARRKVVEENKLQNQVVPGELIGQGLEGSRGADAGEGRAVERVGA